MRRILRMGIAALAVLATVASALLTVVPVLPADWKPRVPLVALGVVTALYLWAEIERGIMGRKQTPAYRDHVTDLQNFARAAAQSAVPGPRMVGNITLSTPLGRSFRRHFPQLGTRMDEWNAQVANDYYGVGSRLNDAVQAEARRVLGTDPGGAFYALLYAIVMKTVRLDNITWWVQHNGQITASSEGDYAIQAVPPTEEQTVKLLQEVLNSAKHVTSIPRVKDWVNRDKRREELWPALIDDLAAVEVTHNPPGRCERCPD